MAICGQTNITINTDRDFTKTHSFTDCDGNAIDLTNYTFFMHVRKTKCADDPPLLDLNTTNGGIAILTPSTDGVIEIRITEAQSEALPTGIFFYDMYWITPSGDKQTIMAGTFTINLSVTRT